MARLVTVAIKGCVLDTKEVRGSGRSPLNKFRKNILFKSADHWYRIDYGSQSNWPFLGRYMVIEIPPKGTAGPFRLRFRWTRKVYESKLSFKVNGDYKECRPKPNGPKVIINP